MVNQYVGATIEKSLQKNFQNDIKVIVANDATCLVLAGTQKNTNRKDIAGYIVGSGANMAFFSDDNTIVTLGAGLFDKIDQTETGKIIDNDSLNPGKFIFEKEVSGLYLYQHYNLLHKQMFLDGPLLTNTKELSEIAEKGTTKEARIAQNLLQQSASLVASQMAGLYLFKDKPQELTIITEGSVIQQGWRYQQMIQDELVNLGVAPGAIKLTHIEDSSLVGAVKLLTLKS